MPTAAGIAYDRGGAGAPLLLVHGLGSRRRFWAPVRERLEAERLVTAIDLPGFGASAPLEGGATPTIPALADAVVRFMDAAGLERPHVAGHSLGGWIALEVARRGRAGTVTAIEPGGFWSEPERLYAKALLSAGVRLARAVEPLLPSLLATPLRRKLLLGALISRPERVRVDEALDDARAFCRSPGFDATLAAVKGKGPEGRFQGGEAIRCPATIVWGGRDSLLLPWQGLRALAAVPSARLLLLPGSGHAPNIDDPDGLLRAILEGSSAPLTDCIRMSGVHGKAAVTA